MKDFTGIIFHLNKSIFNSVVINHMLTALGVPFTHGYLYWLGGN